MLNKGPRPGWVKLIAGLYLLEFIAIFLIVLVLGLLGVYSSTIEILASVLLIILFVIFFGIWRGIKPFWYLALLVAAGETLAIAQTFIGVFVGVPIMYGLFRSDVKNWFNIKYSISSETKPAKFIAIVLALVIIGIVIALISPKSAATSTSSLQNTTTYCIGPPEQPLYTCKNLNLTTQSLSLVLAAPYSNNTYNNVSFYGDIMNDTLYRTFKCTSSTTNNGHGDFAVTCSVSSLDIVKGAHYLGSISMEYQMAPFGKTNFSGGGWTFGVNAT